MSYDLMVFEVKDAPTNKKAFMEWYDQQTEWTENHNYDDPAVTSEALRNWYMDMIKVYAPMNGPYALSEEDFDNLGDKEVYVTDYSVGRSVIYAAFAWSLADQVYNQFRELALKHKVGFFDASGDGDIILPDVSKID
ncbi:hypothetical protein [Bacillus sp. FJAT-52991]|uniref:Uncharacterized protein n=1 Tax=Bacillus kandeliae TaxID=3129297 RepID=A0ABZ2N4M4_9BACI